MNPLHLASHNTANDTATITAFVQFQYGYFISSLARRHSSSFANVSTPSQILPSLSVRQVNLIPWSSRRICSNATLCGEAPPFSGAAPPFMARLIVLDGTPVASCSSLFVLPRAVLACLSCVTDTIGMAICTGKATVNTCLVFTAPIPTVITSIINNETPETELAFPLRPHNQNNWRS